jgi:hypothetical protein
MRFILTILLFLSQLSYGQIINASRPYRPIVVAAGPADLLLDSFPGAAAAYSLRKLDKDYTGAAIRVRESAGNTESDIGFDSNGNLDTVALKNFVGANNGFVVTWYNQADSSGVFGVRNVTQSTAANQPRIVNAGVIDRDGSWPCVRANDGTDALIINGTGVGVLAYSTVVSVVKVNTQQTINYFMGDGNTGLYYNGSLAGVDGLGGFDNFNLRTTSGEDLNRHLGWFNLSGGNLLVARDGGSEINTGTFSTGVRFGRLMGRNSANLNLFGNCQEVVLWTNSQTSNKSGIESNINGYYNVY